jgi:hypothetical protein
MHAQLGQVLLAEETAEVAEKHQDGRAPEQLPRRVATTTRVAKIEVELDPRHPGVG